MEISSRRSSRVQLAIPIRVRGMSSENKFFDEKTVTVMIGKYGLMSRLRSLVDLETEIHVVNLGNEAAGTFRVVWVNTQCQDGFYKLGVEVIEAPDDMWGIYFPPVEPSQDMPGGSAWLECRNCHEKQLGSVPQAELDCLEVGVLVARQCDRCKATTTWEFARVAEPSGDSPVAPPVEEKHQPDQRRKKRSDLNLTIKLIRQRDGRTVEDICKTINVSRTGVYFLTARDYQVGETLKAVIPYKKDGVAAPVAAKVIRNDSSGGSTHRGVAIQLETAILAPELSPQAASADLAAEDEAQLERRTKGRVPLRLPIKVAHQIKETILEDLSETINISRTGACFQSSQNYTLGEKVEVVLPYWEGQQHIPVPGRVVRLDQTPRPFTRAVAISMGADNR